MLKVKDLIKEMNSQDEIYDLDEDTLACCFAPGKLIFGKYSRIQLKSIISNTIL